MAEQSLDAWESLGQRLHGLTQQAESAQGRDSLVDAAHGLAGWAEAALSLGASWASLALVEAKRLLAGAEAGRDSQQLRQRLLSALHAHEKSLAASAVIPAVPKGPAGTISVGPDDAPMFQDFLGEAPQLLQSTETALLELSKGQASGLPEVLRNLHTLKGIFGFMGLAAMNDLCHRSEDCLEPYKSAAHAIPSAVLAWLLKACDAIAAQVQRIDRGLSSGSVELVDLSAFAQAPTEKPGQVQAPLELSEAEAQPSRGDSPVTQDRFIRIRAEKMDALLELVGEMAICQSQVGEGMSQVSLPPALASEVQRLSKISKELQESVLSLRLVPVEPLFLRASRMAHDLSVKTSKPLDFETEGGDTELDKGMVEELAEPLLHLIRNAVDHGLEGETERLAAGKPSKGRLVLSARRDGRDFVLELSDDGQGLNYEALAEKGIQRGLIKAEEHHDNERLTRLIFEPGFSTARELSDVSGRGVGMDAVRRKVLSLKGSIQVHSAQGQGCRFVMRFPLTLSLMEGILVSVAGQRYVVPAGQILKFMSSQETQAHQAAQSQVWLQTREKALPLIDLRSQLGQASEAGQSGISLVVESLGRQAALMVDEVLGKQQVVAKSLGAALDGLQGIAGGAILADGKVSLILDLEALMETSN